MSRWTFLGRIFWIINWLDAFVRLVRLAFEVLFGIFLIDFTISILRFQIFQTISKAWPKVHPKLQFLKHISTTFPSTIKLPTSLKISQTKNVIISNSKSKKERKCLKMKLKQNFHYHFSFFFLNFYFWFNGEKWYCIF